MGCTLRSIPMFTLGLIISQCIGVPSGSTPAPHAPPLILVLHLPLEGHAARTQETLFTELSLVLDGFMLVRATAPAGFGTGTLASQISRVKPIVQRYKAVAAAWLDQPNPGLFMLHVLATRGGRTLIRSFEGDRARGSVATLALATRELLGMAYLFEKTDKQPALAKLVDDVRAEAEAPVRTPPSSFEIRLRALAVVQGGLQGQRGPNTRAGLELGAELEPIPHWLITAAIEVLYGPVAVPKGVQLEVWGVAPTLGVGYITTTGPVELATTLRGFVDWRWTHTDVTGKEQSFRSMHGGLELAAEPRFVLSKSIRLAATLFVGWRPVQDTFRRRSDNALAFRTARFHWGVAFGGVFGKS